MKFISLIVSAVCIFSFAQASAPKNFDSSQIAESLYFQDVHSKNILDSVENSFLTPAHKAEIKSYLDLHHLEKKSVHVSWSGSSELSFSDGTSQWKLDFAEMAKNQTVKLDGIVVDFSRLSNFSDIVQKFENASERKNAFVDFILPEAKAESFDPLKGVSSAIKSLAGHDALESCSEVWLGSRSLWGEDITHSLCPYYKNSKMIITDIGKYGSITELSCTSQGFKSASVLMSYGPLKLTANHDQSGKLSSIAAYENNELACEYTLKSGRIAGTKNDTVTPEYCDGRATSDNMGVPHSLTKGSEPKFVSSFPVPLQRLEKCCLDSGCRSEIASAIHHSTSSKGSPARATR